MLLRLFKISFPLVFLTAFYQSAYQDQESAFWYGYYQEDAGNNPEDPMAGFVYLNIPNDGTFQGELFFSYAGCDGTFDVGNISGTVEGNRIDGNWQGTVDGEQVGGKYSGELKTGGGQYHGTYTNSRGKQEIDCETGGYYVAARGTWFLNGSKAASELEIQVETEAEEDFASFEWTELEHADRYRFVIIDQECLEEQMNLEQCMVWTGESIWPDMEYGDGDIPAKSLTKGRMYLISVGAIDENGRLLKSGNVSFTYN